MIFITGNVLVFFSLAVNNSAAEDPGEGPVSKRMRRLSTKGLKSLQVEKDKMPATKNESSTGKSAKSSTKQMESANRNSSVYDDEATDDEEVNIET